MVRYIYLLCLFGLLTYSACSEPSNTNTTATTNANTSTAATETTTKDSLTTNTANTQASSTPKVTTVLKNCDIKGKVLADNKLFLRQAKQDIYIVANQKSANKHCALEVYDKTNCQQVFQQLLPPIDFPYTLAKINYNNSKQLVAIKGYDKIFCYDINKKQLSKPLIPKYAHECENMDAQSGLIKHLELWENYLIGYAQDHGTFIFDLNNNDKPKALLPHTEYHIKGSSVHNPMFLLTSKDNEQQILLPKFNKRDQSFELGVVWDAPKKIGKINTSPDKRYILIENKNQQPISALDMRIQQTQVIPKEMKDQKTIMNFLKNKNK